MPSQAIAQAGPRDGDGRGFAGNVQIKPDQPGEASLLLRVKDCDFFTQHRFGQGVDQRSEWLDQIVGQCKSVSAI